MGLEVWAPDGRKRIDTNSAAALLFGELIVGGEGFAQSGSIYDSRFSLGDGFVVPLYNGIVSRENYFPVFTIAGNYLYWNYPYSQSTALARPVVTALYGIK